MSQVGPEPALLAPGFVVWVAPDPTIGVEQAGRRPAVIVSSREYLDTITELALVIPVTTSARGWDNHVPLSGPTGLDGTSFAMTEQIRAISRRRIARVSGQVDAGTLKAIMAWLDDLLVKP